MIAAGAANSIPAAYLDMAAKSQIAAAAIDATGKVVNPALLTPAQQLSAALVADGIFQTGLPSGGVFAFGFTALRNPNKNTVNAMLWHRVPNPLESSRSQPLAATWWGIRLSFLLPKARSAT